MYSERGVWSMRSEYALRKTEYVERESVLSEAFWRAELWVFVCFFLCPLLLLRVPIKLPLSHRVNTMSSAHSVVASDSDSRPSKRKRPESSIWTFFTVQPEEGHGRRAQCNLCKNIVSFAQKSTFDLHRHMERHHAHTYMPAAGSASSSELPK
jgi:hypothetical protein